MHGAVFSKRGARELALETTKCLEHACLPLPLPPRPPELATFTARECLQELYAGSGAQLRQAMVTWLCDRAARLADNERRLGGALWCYATLQRLHEERPADTEVLEAGKLMRAFLREVWRIAEPPIELKDRTVLVSKTIEGLAA